MKRCALSAKHGKSASVDASLQAPIAVYTSGKGSSAAGLTATVIKSGGGEFYLEVIFCNSEHCVKDSIQMQDESRQCR